jgi:hypothetical protein
LALKEPENPAGEVLGFGLGKLIGVLFEDGETEITSKDITILKKKIIQTERILEERRNGRNFTSDTADFTSGISNLLNGGYYFFRKPALGFGGFR